jgi:hypothetical protein
LGVVVPVGSFAFEEPPVAGQRGRSYATAHRWCIGPIGVAGAAVDCAGGHRVGLALE